ncbi:MAG: caspase family protein, partial [Bacteroidota bacterium]
MKPVAIHFTCIFKLVFIAPCIFCSTLVFSQDLRSMFRVEKVELPKFQHWHKTIIGKDANDRILVQCAKSDDPKPGDTRKFFWVQRLANGQILPPTEDKDIGNVWDIATFDTITYYMAQSQGGKQLLDNRTGHQVDLLWNEGEKINQPFIIHLYTSDYPIMVFSAVLRGKKDADLFVCERTLAGWSRPERIANPAINTPFEETSPWVANDGTIFFSTNRPHPDSGSTAAGQPDIWFAAPDYHRFWSKASVNPLDILNSAAAERSFVASNRRLRSGFFVSDRDGGQFDLFSFVSTAPDSLPIEPRYHALVIGANDYQYANDLDSAITNSRALKKALEEYRGFSVDLLENPTGEAILDKLKQYQNLEEHEYLVVIFSGHGFKVERPDGNGWFCVLAGADGKSDGSNCITPEAFAQAIAFIERPRHILVILNACWSGGFQSQPMRGSF